MNPVRAIAALGLLLCCAQPDAAHITDKLAVPLYGSVRDDTPQRILTSGTPLELLDRGGRLCRVRLGDGDTGWLECRYITDEKPARVMLVEAQARAGDLWNELERLKGTLEARELTIGELESRLQAAQRLLAREPAPFEGDAGSEIPNAAPASGKRSATAQANLAPWLCILIGGAAGFLAGASFVRWRIRKRFRGLRI